MSEQKYSLEDLLFLMQTLRHPEHGCAWDMQQRYEDIAPYTLEETYEVLQAIEQGDLTALRDELGDLLFQVVFYAQIADESAVFNFSDVIHAIVSKMLFRHPHVFPDGTLASAGQGQGRTLEDIGLSWSALKAQERAQNHAQTQGVNSKQNAQSHQKAPTNYFSDIPLALPAAERAQRLQKKVTSVGFDWPDKRSCLTKLQEEIGELIEAVDALEALDITETVEAKEASEIAQRDVTESEHQVNTAVEAVSEELGDVLFSAINVARKMGLNAEQVLRKANLKFERRFTAVLAQLEAVGVDEGALEKLSRDEQLELLEQYWQRVKTDEKDDA